MAAMLRVLAAAGGVANTVVAKWRHFQHLHLCPVTPAGVQDQQQLRGEAAGWKAAYLHGLDALLSCRVLHVAQHHALCAASSLAVLMHMCLFVPCERHCAACGAMGPAALRKMDRVKPSKTMMCAVASINRRLT